MWVLYLVLFIAALVCFAVSAANRPTVKYNLVAAGLFLVTLVWTIQLIKAHA